MQDDKPNLTTFRQFSLLDKLSDEQLIVLASRADYRHFKKGRTLLELNSRDSFDYFLLSGEVVLIAADGRQTRVEANSGRARLALAYLQPRQFEVKALSDSRMLVVDQPTLTQMLKEVPAETAAVASSSVQDVDSPAYAIISAFHQDLRNHRLKLPSLPDLALQIKAMSEKPGSHATDLAKIIVRDPPITAKLIRAANSPLYRGFNAIESCQDAVVRLGMEATRQLINVFTLRELFSSQSALLKRRMQKLWDHSLEVGAIAFVLARMSPGLSAELAMLAGILHDIGAVPVIQYAEQHAELRGDDQILATIISELREETGCAMLTSWSFPEALIEAVRHAEDYSYDSGSDQLSYADLIILAQVHAFIGKPELARVPSMDTIPAFSKLDSGDMSPQRSLQVLQKSREEIKELKRMLI